MTILERLRDANATLEEANVEIARLHDRLHALTRAERLARCEAVDLRAALKTAVRSTSDLHRSPQAGVFGTNQIGYVVSFNAVECDSIYDLDMWIEYHVDRYERTFRAEFENLLAEQQQTAD